MSDSLAGLKEFCGVYLDDIILYSRCMQQYLGHLHTVLSHLQDFMLSFKRPKSDFLKSSLHFLGHVISPSGVAPDPSKVAAIRDMAAPTDVLHCAPSWDARISMSGLFHSMPPYVFLSWIY